nr:hypothetical protein [Nocardia tengchongensis]
MIGVVVVSHSRALAEAAVALAVGLLPDQAVSVRIAAGLSAAEFGTDAVAVAEAITAADSGDGVLVLMDLGSAVLSAATALDLLESPVRVRLSAAPLVEGLVAALAAAVGEPIWRRWRARPRAPSPPSRPGSPILWMPESRIIHNHPQVPHLWTTRPSPRSSR